MGQRRIVLVDAGHRGLYALRRGPITGMVAPRMKTPCRHPGCSALLDRSGYCDAHADRACAPAKDYDRHRRAVIPHLAHAARVRSSAAWQRLRRLKLSMSPLCQDPHGDHARANQTDTASQVHHIEPLATHPDLGLELSNLMSVCTRCHARLEREVPIRPPIPLTPPRTS